jgi:thiol-disulfide isomerase/thioredoxin
MVRNTIKFSAVGLLVALAVLPGCGRRDEQVSEERVARESTAWVEESSDVGTTEGKLPPAFELPDLSGNVVTLADYEGKVVVLDLWATWCPPCRQEIPFLVSLYEEHKDAGLVVVGIGLDDGGAKVLEPFVKQNSVTYPILVGNRDVGQTYQLKGIPTTFILDRNGRIAAKHLGFRPSDADVMRAEVARLLATAGEEA